MSKKDAVCKISKIKFCILITILKFICMLCLVVPQKTCIVSHGSLCNMFSILNNFLTNLFCSYFKKDKILSVKLSLKHYIPLKR